jgi:hypothetical protein
MTSEFIVTSEFAYVISEFAYVIQFRAYWNFRVPNFRRSRPRSWSSRAGRAELADRADRADRAGRRTEPDRAGRGPSRPRSWSSRAGRRTEPGRGPSRPRSWSGRAGRPSWSSWSAGSWSAESWSRSRAGRAGRLAGPGAWSRSRPRSWPAGPERSACRPSGCRSGDWAGSGIPGRPGRAE